MGHYLARRLLLFIPTLFAVSLLIFLVLRIVPGDVAVSILLGSEGREATAEDIARLRHELGLDKPIVIQYVDWVTGLARLDLGKSLYTKELVSEYIANRFPVTLELALLTSIVSVLLGIPLGLISAVRQNSFLDYIMRLIGIGGVTIPNFWLGTLLLLALVTLLGWAPPLGFPTLFEDPLKNLTIMVWPSLVLGYHFTGYLSRMTRSCMLEVLRQDYVRTAWSKGLRERAVVLRHALRNALLPVVTLLGLQMGALIGGTIVVEAIFVLPGVGLTLIDAISTRDYPLVQAIVVLFALSLLIINLVVDLLYGWLDPRIRYA